MVLRRLILLLILLLALTPPATAIDVRPGVPALVVIPAGFTDVAIQNAINSVNAAGGGEVRLAPGTYKKAGANWASLSLSDHVILRGPLCNRGGWWASTGKGAVLVNNDNATTI